MIFGLYLYLFYESVLPAVILFPLWFFYMKEWLEDMARKKELEFRNQFRDSIQIMSSALKTGYSEENAIRETYKDLTPMYGKETRIVKEYSRMVHKLDMSIPIGQILEEFSSEAEQEDVENFVNVFAASKKTGGDSIAVIRNAVKIISEKIDTEKEIQTMIASKKLEFQIMSVIPFGIIFYLKITFREFLEILYNSSAGKATMSVCLAIYLAAYICGKKIIQIDL